MRRLTSIRVVTASCVLAVHALAAAAAQGEVPWITDFQQARRDGLQRNQPLLLEFWATWCGPCKSMDLEVFSQERVASAMKKVLPVRIDIDRHPDLARKYRVGGTPTFVVSDGYGNELLRHAGLLGSDQLIAVLEALPTDLARVNTLAASAAKDKDDVVPLNELGDELRRHGLYVASSEYYARALKTRAGRERNGRRAAMLAALARNQIVLRAFDDAAKTAAQLRREFPDHPDAAAVSNEIAAARGAAQRASGPSIGRSS